MAKIIGIDLGTTTSLVSYLKNGKPEIIANKLGKRLTDSVVGIDKYGTIIVGEEAKRILNGTKVEEIKRSMGTNKKVKLGDKEYSPEEISAEILKKLKEEAEDFLGEEVNEAVITVPAMFNSIQKAATIKAGELAGLKVERIISEPTAAAMAYGIENMEKYQKILVYDFGGGTFDVSILELDDGILDVIATSGDNYLGGKDIDEILMKNISVKIEDNIEKIKLKLEVEEAKKRLSTLMGTDIIVPELNIDYELKREKFEELISPLVNKTIDFIDKALSSAKLKREDINVVLLVGGTTRIPLVQETLKKIFGSKVKKFTDPQEAVALGAGVQAGIKSSEISSEDGLIITDICNYSLGVASIGEYQGIIMPDTFSVIIPKNSNLPCTKSDTYCTAVDDQTSVDVKVYQGENKLVCENLFLSEFKIEGIPKNKAGAEVIEITFGYNINDILTVEAKILSTGVTKSIKIELNNKNKGNIDKKGSTYKNSSYYSDYKIIMEMAEDKMSKLSETNREKVSSILEKMKEMLVSENKEELDKLDSTLTDLLFEV
ncbi:Hsp70 family protein [Fusobacterium pseudoperiodonticum]|uniref:Hsp70 family protein n=1 Tax=Fusobacterium pseudoperiodonticum TaxID=2663009 RepID=UPI0030D02B89